MTDDDQRELENVLLAHPTAGSAMSGAGGLRKMRYAPRASGAGKSGGTRVCYAHFPKYAHVYFVVAFAKNEQPNLTATQKNMIHRLLTEIDGFLRRTNK
jgi:hypothetical protein